MTKDTAERLLRERFSYRPGGEVTLDNVGEFLLYGAKSSSQTRLALAKALLLPWLERSPLPRIGDRELLSAIRVGAFGAELCNSGKTGRDTWQRIIRALLIFVRFQKQPSLRKEIIRARAALKVAAEYSEVESEILEDLLTDLVSVNTYVPETRHLHPGGHFKAEGTRQLAAIMLFRECGETKRKAREHVKKLLRTLGKYLEVDSLERLEERYRKALKRGRRDADIALEHLTRFWLHRLGDLMMLIDLPQKYSKFAITGGPLVTSWKGTSSRLVGTRSPSSKRLAQAIRPNRALMPDTILLNQLRQLYSLIPEVPRVVGQPGPTHSP